MTCSSCLVAFYVHVPGWLVQKRPVPTPKHVFAGCGERFEVSSATPLLSFPLPCCGAMHFCTPTAHHQTLYLPVHLPSGEHREDLEGCKDTFPPPTCRPCEETPCDVTWCGACGFDTWCDCKAQLLKWHSNYIHGAGEGTLLNKGSTALPKSASHFTQSIWEERPLHFLSWLPLMFQSNIITINP